MDVWTWIPQQDLHPWKMSEVWPMEGVTFFLKFAKTENQFCRTKNANKELKWNGDKKLVHDLWYDILGCYFGMISLYFGMKNYYDFSQFSWEIYFEANSRQKRLSDFIKKNSTAIRSFFDSAERKKVNKFLWYHPN